MILILGAGLAGLSCSYHIGHEKCLLLEKRAHPYGHIHTDFLNGFTWDEGPHVSFTDNDYVRDLFADAVDGEFEEYPVRTENYFHGTWVDHPAQSNLYQVSEPLRNECVRDFLAAQKNTGAASPPKNYQEWLEQAFGKTFANTFPAAYTRKYWTLPPSALTTEWVGKRVFRPKVQDVLNGSCRPLAEQTHYIKKVRYPTRGGYQAFARKLVSEANIHYNKSVIQIDLSNRKVTTADGACWSFTRLINTLPLPVFIKCCIDTPAQVRDAAGALACSEVLLVNVTAPHPTRRLGNWFYVYDEDKYSTRINCTEVLSPHNAPPGHTGIQVEVYASRLRPFSESFDLIASKVIGELMEMGFLDELAVAKGQIKTHTRLAHWANVIFDHSREPALETILNWLESKGLARENDDLDPATDWNKSASASVGLISLAGRFGQWKYFWTDDCVLRGRMIGSAVNMVINSLLENTIS